jgi:predicted metalloendopeptidase
MFVAFVNLDVGYTAPSNSIAHVKSPQPDAPVTTTASVRRTNVLDKANYDFPPQMLQNMDLSKSPCENFYEFSCAGYEARTVLPDWTPSWALAWDNVGNKTRLELVKLLETSNDSAGQWFRACMNIPTSRDFVLVEAHLTAIQSVGSMPEFFNAIGLLNRIGTSVFFDWSVQNDEQNPSRRILSMSEGGISLPDKDYYTQVDTSAVNMLHSVIVEIMHLAGYAQADAQTIASDAVAIETHLAAHMWSNTEARVAKPKRYSLAEFQKVTPGFDWVHVFDVIVAEMMKVNDKVVLHNPLTSGQLFEVDNLHGFYAGMSKIITVDQLPRLKHYMLVRRHHPVAHNVTLGCKRIFSCGSSFSLFF